MLPRVPSEQTAGRGADEHFRAEKAEDGNQGAVSAALPVQPSARGRVCLAHIPEPLVLGSVDQADAISLLCLSEIGLNLSSLRLNKLFLGKSHEQRTINLQPPTSKNEEVWGPKP